MNYDEIENIGIWLDTETYPDLKMPLRAHTTDAGSDIHSAEDLFLEVGERVLVHTGVYLQMREGWECQVRPRSGLALKNGITVLNSPGTIDADYRGEVCVILYNSSEEDFEINKGDRIAQLVFKQVPQVALTRLTEKPGGSKRGEAGFGSSGIKTA